MIVFSKRNLNRVLRLARLLEYEEAQPDRIRRSRRRRGNKRSKNENPSSHPKHQNNNTIIRVKDQTVFPINAVEVDPSVRFSEFVQIGDPEGEVPWNVNTAFWSTFVGCQSPFRSEILTDPQEHSLRLFRFCSCSNLFIESILDQADPVHEIVIHADSAGEATIGALIRAKAQNKSLYVDSLLPSQELKSYSADTECTSFTFSSRKITEIESLILILRSLPNLWQLELHVPSLTQELVNVFHELIHLTHLTIKVRIVNCSEPIDIPTHLDLVALSNGLIFKCPPNAISTPLHKHYTNVNMSICAVANGLLNLLEPPTNTGSNRSSQVNKKA